MAQNSTVLVPDMDSLHHLEIRDASDIDDEVAAWLREAAERSG